MAKANSKAQATVTVTAGVVLPAGLETILSAPMQKMAHANTEVLMHLTGVADLGTKDSSSGKKFHVWELQLQDAAGYTAKFRAWDSVKPADAWVLMAAVSKMAQSCQPQYTGSASAVEALMYLLNSKAAFPCHYNDKGFLEIGALPKEPRKVGPTQVE